MDHQQQDGEAMVHLGRSGSPVRMLPGGCRARLKTARSRLPGWRLSDCVPLPVMPQSKPSLSSCYKSAQRAAVASYRPAWPQRCWRVHRLGSFCRQA